MSPSWGPDVFMSHETWKRHALSQGSVPSLSSRRYGPAYPASPTYWVEIRARGAGEDVGEEGGAVSTALDKAGLLAPGQRCLGSCSQARECRVPGWRCPGSRS